MKNKNHPSFSRSPTTTRIKFQVGYYPTWNLIYGPSKVDIWKWEQTKWVARIESDTRCFICYRQLRPQQKSSLIEEPSMECMSWSKRDLELYSVPQPIPKPAVIESITVIIFMTMLKSMASRLQTKNVLKASKTYLYIFNCCQDDYYFRLA